MPTTNLNNGAGSNRSNVAWGDVGTPAMTGDDFILGGSGSYNVTDIRTWVVGANVGADMSLTGGVNPLYSSLTLWLGPGGNNAVSATGYSFTAQKVHYNNDGVTNYQGTSGSFDDIWQLDWNTTGLALNANALENFAVSGVTTAAGQTALGYQNIVFNHASNAALSGSPQQGADNLFREWNADGTWSDNWDSGAKGGGWDKSSDINVQVFPAATPEPFTLSLGIASVGLFIRRRMKARKA
ncbi:MAG: hypothetical protein ACYC96_14515 [Fimbriimonadaceae bacterium]